MTITKSAVTSVPVHELIAERWSPRAFNGHAVSQDQIHALLEAARWAPSSYNLQPWRFVVWNRDDNADTFDKVYATLSSSNKAWVANVPVLIGVFADRRGVDGQENGAAAYDTGAAAFSLVLQAQALGLHAHQLGGFNRSELQREFAIPEDIVVQALIAVGYQGDEALLRDDLRAKEQAARSRRSLNEIAFTGQWGQAF